MIRNYLFDLAKIVEGATNGDLTKVAAYVKQLGDRLEADGEVEGAKRIRQILGQSRARKFGLSHVGAPGSGSAHVHLPVDSESRLSIADEQTFSRGEVELFLRPSDRAGVERFITYIRAADRLVAHGVGIAGSMLMHGPPGCGKTQTARYIASELQLPLISARLDGLISSYLGSTAKNLRSLFDHAASRPCVLFLDEFDAIAKMRDDGRELGELKRVVISLLQNIDALGPEHVLLAATNHEHLLDPAIWRRFNYKLRLNEPDRATRHDMLEKFLGGFAAPSDVHVLAAVGEGMTGAQLRQLSDDAIRAAVIADRRQIDLAATVQAVIGASSHLTSANPGLEQQVRALYELDRKTFTQATLAALFGISQPKVSRLLKSER